MEKNRRWEQIFFFNKEIHIIAYSVHVLLEWTYIFFPLDEKEVDKRRLTLCIHQLSDSQDFDHNNIPCSHTL